MKTLNKLPALALALAAFAAPLALRASTGDIVDIRVVDTDEMTFGDRSSLSPSRCTADHPLVAGDELYIRVRMLVRNWPNVIGGTEEPETWYFANLLGSSLLYPPKLGIMIGDRAAYAEFSEYGPRAWQKSGMLDNNDAGSPSAEWRFYTDLYFCYKVQPGDLGLPVRLMNSTGTGPASTTDDDTGYYILNCGPSSFWALQSTAGVEAKFSYGPEVLPVPASKAWPDGIPGDTALRNYDLSAEGAFVKTIDFDKVNAAGDPYSEGDVWRDVYPGMSATPGTVPTLVIGGGASTAATTVYIWSGDETVVVPVASGANTVSTVDGKQVLKVVVPSGVESVTFSMKGADAATVGDVATIYMSPAQGAVYKPSGELADITVSRTVRVVTAPQPTVTIELDGANPATKTVTATADYVTRQAQLVVKMTPACDYPVTVRLNALVSGDDTLTCLQDLYDENIIRIADGDYGGDPLDQETIDVEIPANKSVVYKNIYVLGGTSKTGNKGITFTTTKISGPDSVTTKGSCTLKVNRSTPVIADSDPEFSTETSPSTITVVSGSSVDFSLAIEDAYRELYDTAAGYTFKWSCDTEEIDDATGVTMNGDGLFEASAEFNAITDGTELTLCVVNPDGKTSAKVKYNLVVTDAKKTTIAFQDPTKYVFPESDSAMENVVLALSQSYNSGVSYIFLESDDPASFACIDSSLKTSGAQVDRGRTATVMPFYQMRFLDGTTNVTVKAVLYKNSDHSGKLTTYTPGTLSFAITNVPPQVTSVTAAGQYLTPDMAGLTISPVARGVAKSFTLVAEDVAADLPTATARWIIDGTQYDTTMDPANPGQTLAVKHTFANAKDKAQVRVYLKDKDMPTYPATPNFMFYVPVTEKPGVSIETNAEGGIFMETAKSVSTITVRLSEPASSEITVRFKVSQAADGGYLKIRTVAGSVAQAVDGGGDPIPGEYDLTFASGVTTKTLVVSDMDGTNDTYSGLDLNAKVTTETENPDGVKWCDFYTPADPVLVRVMNEAPEILRPTEEEEAYTNMNASANTPYSISYACTDVDADMAAKVTVNISIDGVTVCTTNVTTRDLYTYVAEFSGEGLHIVEFAFTDKDRMTSRRTVKYYVQPSKNLQLRAHSPAGSMAAENGHSVHYGSAAGIGAGRVYAGSTGPQKISSFVHEYSFNIGTKSVVAHAYGYKADGSRDDGTLTPGPDAKIDKNGNWSKGDTTPSADCFSYRDWTADNWLRSDLDSFVYGWVFNLSESTTATSGGAEGSETVRLQPTSAGETVIVLPDAEANSSSSSGGAVATQTPKQYWEAVFSREWLPADNCGDINADGIPDLVLRNYGFGIVDVMSGKIEVSTEGASQGDLADLSKYNNDVDADGAESPDYLPSTATSAYGSLIPGLSGTWVTLGTPFGAKLEVRGYHDGLNDAMEQLGIRDNGKSVKSDRIYGEEVDGTWKWTENCTISELEWYAWTEYAAANGLLWTNRADWVRWSPERPTNPTMYDTDGDGFPDGYEYYFWYRAHVGYFETDSKGARVHRRMTGRRYDPKNPGEGRAISSEEIERLMDPLTASGSADTVLLLDSDNDGIPDLIEFEIGTNPFDFDSDGDGLADGWELMIANLNPLLAQSANDGTDDGKRNFDGDAMAISSFALEKAVQPTPLHPENAQYTTFAVIDADGDTDGVQWFATKAEVSLATNTVSGWAFKLADGTECVATEKPALTSDGRLAKTLDKGVAYTATLEKKTVVDDSDPDNPVTTEVTVATRGWPVRLGAGTAVDPASVADDPTEVSVASVAAAIAEKSANAAWVYGRGSDDATRGAVADSAAKYGCLALGRQKAVAKGLEVCAAPSSERDVALLHYLVYQQFGFDPRTAWSPKSPLASRWTPTQAGSAYCAHAARTRAYTTYDEFLVYSFFLNNGCDMSGWIRAIAATAPSLAQTWRALTTNPQGPNEPALIELDTSAAEDGTATYYYGWNSDNGADTDRDGVPDGWELYVMAGPKRGGAFVFAPPYASFQTVGGNMPKSYFSPFVASAKSGDTNSQAYTGAHDDLNEYEEFEGTDSMNYYAGVYGSGSGGSDDEGEGSAASATIVHSGDWKWINKFFPTDPWSADTDDDGISDSGEKGEFSYTCEGTAGPVDDGKLRSVPGGGLNPCSVDTDFDGLPDPWEKQFAGKTPFPGKLPEMLAEKGNKTKDADGNEGNYLQGLVDGMDGTVVDALNYPIRYSAKDIGVAGSNEVHYVSVDGVAQVVNRDYDHDGLDNWQEYMTGMMRCWRYDDPFSPWEPIPSEFYWTYDESTGVMAWDPKYDDVGMSRDEFWYATLVDKTSPYYNPYLVTDTSSGAQYLTRVENAWDRAYMDDGVGVSSGAYYWFYDRVAGGTSIIGHWSKELPLANGWRKAPAKYPCCSPKSADSDHDGMDDYYELFHGMNPLLGKSGVRLSQDAPCDLVYDAWANDMGALTATFNYWQMNPWRTPRGSNGYDFEVFPWLNGIVDADPDGDVVPNSVEAMMPKVNTNTLHTDPTPLWMTDSSFDGSLVNRFFRMPTRLEPVYNDGESFTYDDETYYFRDFDTWVAAKGAAPSHFAAFAPDYWSLVAAGEPNWICSFEENEGFDSDHDGIGDYEEKEGKLGGSHDPQDADSPRRRQAMYFQGPSRPSALQTMPEVIENYPVAGLDYPDDPSFLQYTVECWVRPTALDDSVIVERSVWTSVEHPADEEYMRKNFQLAIKNGFWYTKFDPVGTAAGGPVEAVSKTAAVTTKWTHLAATYDGEYLAFYVDGAEERRVRSGLPPSYGSEALVLRSNNKYWYDLEYPLCAVIVGASAKTMSEGAADGGALDVTRALGWDRYGKFFSGWIDEIRIWDGARTKAEIQGAMNTRMSSTLAAENRASFYEKWSEGNLRYVKDGSAWQVPVPAELRYHWAFDSLFGADNENAVATAPHGFGDPRALLSRPEGYEIPWWKKVLEGDGDAPGYAGTVYSAADWVSWIPNTVTHLPRFDGTTLDSIYWSTDFMGTEMGTYTLPTTAEPVSRWTQLRRARTTLTTEYRSTGSRHLLINTLAAEAKNAALANLFDFTARHLNQYGDDLVALGGAYARYCDNDVGLWDDQGASTNWETTGTDADGDGLPDWWEQYADENYRPSGMDPSEEIVWSTVLDWHGLSITAGEAYLRDLARGAYLDRKGDAVVASSKYEQRADEDGNGVPDWWEDIYGIRGESGLADHDNDGLPNYVEYLLSEVFAFDDVVFDPTDPCSVDQYTPDYFFPVGSLYVGEIFTDHDLVDDDWEDKYPTLDDGITPYASRLAYDAFADADEDGWSNRSEVRYSKTVIPIVANTQTHYTSADGLVADYPIPTLALTLRYNGGRQDAVRTAPIVVEVSRSSKGDTTPDAKYVIGAAPEAKADSGQDSKETASSGVSYTRTLGKWANRHMLGTLTPGNVQLNSLSLEFCYDPSSVVYTYRVYYAGHDDGRNYVKRGTRREFDYDKRKYGDRNVDLIGSDDGYAELKDLELRTDESGSVATWMHTTSGSVLGTINLTTGAFDMDFTVLKGQFVENSTNSAQFASLEEQTYRIVYASLPSVGLPRHLYLGAADKGHVHEGSNDIVAFADLDGNGVYSPDEPYGILQGVGVSWKGVSAELELTDESPIAARFDVWDSGTAQYGLTNIVTESETGGKSQSSGSAEAGALPKDDPVRVRVVRWKVDGFPSYRYPFQPRVVLEKMMDPRIATTLTEADFLGADAFDIDWEYFSGEVANSGVSAFYPVVEADYLVVIGDGPVSWSSSSDTNTVVTASTQVIKRRFDESRVLPVPVSAVSVSPVSAASGVVNSANPTFTWKIGSGTNATYTAFRIQVTNDTETIYDSGIRRAPARDEDGAYRWTAPIYADDMTPDGKVFANKSSYGWRVAMYNAKFRSDEYSTGPASFFLNVQTNGYFYGSVDVAVRYFGPSDSYDARVVRVQAFTSPDFTGIPVAAGYVKGKSATLARTGAAPEANCSVIGLPAGKYYLRAFIDSDKDGECDDWESSGYLCDRDGSTPDVLVPTAVTIGPEAGKSDLAVIYIDDADTDGDGLPDSWEYAKYGSLEAKGIELLSETPAGEALVNAKLSGALELRAGARAPSAGLAAKLRSGLLGSTGLGNAGTLALALGAPLDGYASFTDAISATISDKLAEDGVKITSLSIADGKVVIALEVETESTASGFLLSTPTTGIPVKATVLWKQSLADTVWQTLGSKEFTVGSGEEEISVGNAGEGASGFFKVVVEEK
ncbi:MAG: LamG domain-containing protein [Kiritimatiellae bacterium]|nr:LamG domain-containing protein [Kiritimatiellia bacterium]